MKRFVIDNTHLSELPSDAAEEIHITYKSESSPYYYDFSLFHRLKHLHYVHDGVGCGDVLPDGLDILQTYDFIVPSNVFRGSVLCLNQWDGPSDMVSALTSLHVLIVLTILHSDSLPDSCLPPNLTQLHAPDDCRLGPRGQSLWRSRDVMQKLYPDLFRTFDKLHIFSYQ